MARKDIQECCDRAVNEDVIEEAFRAANCEAEDTARREVAKDLRRRATDLVTEASSACRARKAERVTARDIQAARRVVAEAEARRAPARKPAAQRRAPARR